MKYLWSLCLAALLWQCKSNNSTLFTAVSPAASGIEFSNSLTESPDFNVLKYGYFYNGGGVAAADFTNDGLLDLYFTGNLSANKLYINKGDFKFEDMTEKAQVAAADGWNTGVSVVDINNDGWLDIYVCRSAAENPTLRKNKLFINHGPKKPFTEEAAAYGLDDAGYSTQALFFDYDHDADLDLFLLNHSVQQYAGFSRLLAAAKTQQNPAYSSKLYRNDTQGGQPRFTDVTEASGLISNVLSFGLGVVASDFNQDGWLDLYVSNDYNEEDYFYVNQQNGTFRQSVREAMPYTSLFSMGCDAADFTNDGYTDLLTLDMLPHGNARMQLTSGDDNFDKYNLLISSGFHHQSMRNMLHQNNADGTFTEMGQLAGVSNTDWSWSALWGDLNLDGWKDLFISNGYARDYTNMDFLKFSATLQEREKMPSVMEIIEQMPEIREANYVFENTAKGTFINRQTDWGLEEKDLSNGAILADLDNDGDLDLVINRVNQIAAVYKNQTASAEKSSLRIDLAKATDAQKIGAKVWVYGKNLLQFQEFSPVRGFQSSSYAPLIFATPTPPDSIRIVWADGRTELRKGTQDKNLTFSYQATLPTYMYASKAATPLTEMVNLSFKTSPQNDFRTQPLLPFMQKTLGQRLVAAAANPNWIWVVSNDAAGSDLLDISTPTPRPIAHFPLPNPLLRPTDAVVTDVTGDGVADVLIAYFGYQAARQNGDIYFMKGISAGKFAPPQPLAAQTNPLSLAVLDVNHDGRLDVVAGGYAESGNYPVSAPTVILLNDGAGNFRKHQTLKSLQLVTMLRQGNLDADADLELVAATQFGAIQQIDFSGATPSVKPISPTGIWFSVAIADMDNDGKADVIGGNLGENNQWKALTDSTLTLLTARPKTGGIAIPILGFMQQKTLYPFASRDELIDQIPSLKPIYTTYAAYAAVSLADIAAHLEKTYDISTQQANTFSSGICWNNGTSFAFQALPQPAQLAPIFVLAVSGATPQQLFLAGNVAATRVRTGKLLGNMGLILEAATNRKWMPKNNGIVRETSEIRGAYWHNNKLFISSQPLTSQTFAQIQ